jgi:hypothetical protein
MRETRLYGSVGGKAKAFPTPIVKAAECLIELFIILLMWFRYPRLVKRGHFLQEFYCPLYEAYPQGGPGSFTQPHIEIKQRGFA